RDPRASNRTKMQQLLQAFPRGRVVVLLDNFEDLVDSETLTTRDVELAEALRVLLSVSQHAIKVILTTRIQPRDIALVEVGRQAKVDLDSGLDSPYAENIMRAMDIDGKVGLRDAPASLLTEAQVRTKGYPRALEALYAILSADRATTLPELLADASKLL